MLATHNGESHLHDAPDWERLNPAEKQDRIAAKHLQRRNVNASAAIAAAEARGAERQKKYDEARTALIKIRELEPREEELQPKKRKLQAAKDEAADKCETACAPLRKAIEEIEGTLFSYRVAQKVVPQHLHTRRGELQQKIQPHIIGLQKAVAAIDAELDPITEELDSIREITGDWLKWRNQLLGNLPESLAVPLYVARQAVVWASRRNSEAVRAHDLKPSGGTAAELVAAAEALSLAGSESAAVEASALALE